jgi:hypothetical protein
MSGDEIFGYTLYAEHHHQMLMYIKSVAVVELIQQASG